MARFSGIRRYSYVFATLFTVVAGMAFIPACSKKSDGKASHKKLPGLNLTLSSETPAQGTDVELVISGEYSIASVSWSIFKKEADGTLNSAGMCVQTETTKSICTFEEAGEYVAKAIIKLVSGTYVGVEKEFTVKAPDGLRNQDPIIVLKMTAGAKNATVATFKAEEAGDAAFPVNAAITFDFGTSRDDEGVANLTYEAKLGASASFESVGASFTRTFDSVGVKVVTVRATDADGNKTEKSFSLFVTCGSDVPDLTLNSDAIAVAATSGGNFLGINWHTYKGTGLRASGGLGPFQYRWDFNGDGLYDTDWITVADLPYPVYSNHMNQRKVRVKVWDTQCNFVKVAEKEVNFDWSPVFVTYANDAELAAGPKLGDQMYYIQGAVSGTSENMLANATANVDSFTSDQFGSPHKPKRVMCNYSRPKVGDKEDSRPLPQGNFHIFGLERYAPRPTNLDPTDKNPYKQDGLFHGIELRMNGIPDSLDSAAAGTVAITTVVPGGSVKPVVDFYTDRLSDSTLERQFSNSQDCSMKFVVKKIDDGDPCAPIVVKNQDFSGTFERGGKIYGVSIWGTFSCPELKDKYNETVKIEDGAFFCEEIKVDACVGCCCCCCCCGVPPIPQ